MPLSPQTEHTLQQMATRTFNPKNLPLPSSEDSLEAFLREQNVIPACPLCGGRDIKKNGKTTSNRQRFRCKLCGRTLGYSSGTPYQRSKHPYSIWREAICCFERKIPLREIAEQTGVSTHTLCQWRQRYLNVYLKLFEELLEEMQAKGFVKDDADLDKVLNLIEAEIDKVYRGRSPRLAKERLRKWRAKWLEKQAVKLGLFRENNTSIQNHPMVPHLPST